MKIQNNYYKNNSTVAFKGSDPLDNLFSAERSAKGISNILKSNIPKKSESNIMKQVAIVLSKLAKNSKFLKIAEKEKTLAYILVLGNTCKEFVGTIIYTVQALTNVDLPPDKRKFVGMYDLSVGLVSTSLSLITGLSMVKYQDKFIEKLVGGEAAKNLPSRYKAISGLAFLLPLVLQNILIKRIIAPACATPVAGILKRRMEEKEAASKIQLTQSELLMPHNPNGDSDSKNKQISTPADLAAVDKFKSKLAQ